MVLSVKQLVHISQENIFNLLHVAQHVIAQYSVIYHWKAILVRNMKTIVGKKIFYTKGH